MMLKDKTVHQQIMEQLMENIILRKKIVFLQKEQYITGEVNNLSKTTASTLHSNDPICSNSKKKQRLWLLCNSLLHFLDVWR